MFWSVVVVLAHTLAVAVAVAAMGVLRLLSDVLYWYVWAFCVRARMRAQVLARA